MSGNVFFVLVVAFMVAGIQEGEARGTYGLAYYQPQAAQYVQYVPQAYAEHAKQVQYYSAPTCYCYGHSYQCAAQGVCANCQHNTIGNMCQYCRPGYTGMATRGTAYDCQPAVQYYYQPQAAAVEAPLHVKQAAAYVQAAPMHVKQAAPEAYAAPVHVKQAAAYVAPAAYAAPAFKQPE
ncbi:cuticle protein 21-like isoform X1 [Branchiostoma floridae]|uniref:Cuticle protein 21-like isoform X1 n=1 Tax=Branchiostoma floridae TaxID=7739 RepID=C3ZFD1_BRAFL|nr:cuticle protein 21-like isoform X1 [Branchiostoma floridae]|eukprot:XP_002592674.1 hypothetical protein BRAFLDRAFT_118389 [Branchiostoma floridae]